MTDRRSHQVLRHAGRAEAVVLLLVGGALRRQELVAHCFALDVSNQEMLIAADRLAKQRKIPFRPFDWRLYTDIHLTFPADNTPSRRWCGRCGRYKHPAEFSKNGSNERGPCLTALCTDHHNERQRQRYRDRRDAA